MSELVPGDIVFFEGYQRYYRLREIKVWEEHDYYEAWYHGYQYKVVGKSKNVMKEIEDEEY